MGTKIDNKGRIGQVNTTEKGDIHAETGNPGKPGQSVWGNGIFFLLSILLIGGGIYLIAAQRFSFAMSSLIFVAAILLFTVVGAFVLRASGYLKEENFLKLIAMAFKRLVFFQRGKGENNPA
jgi:hypothetical protein